MIAAFDAVEEIAAVAFAVVGDDRRGVFIAQILDALAGAEVELDPCPLIGALIIE
jgi:hypothetical protein